jgi:phosphoribosyl-AMP cyclohydrolase
MVRIHNMRDNKKKSIKSLELIPAIIQDYKTNEVLMLAYMSKVSKRVRQVLHGSGAG